MHIKPNRQTEVVPFLPFCYGSLNKEPTKNEDLGVGEWRGTIMFYSNSLTNLQRQRDA